MLIGVVIPSAAERRRMQVHETAFYWSACAEGVLRRHGIVNVRTEEADAKTRFDDGVALVMRGVRWTDADRPAILEGPLAPETASAMGVTATARVSDRLVLREASGAEAGALAYQSCDVRRIPKTRREVSLPTPNRPADPRWSNRDIRFQTFEPGAGWAVVLEAEVDGVWHPVALRRGSLLVLGVPVFDLLAAGLAFPPLEAGYFAMTMMPSAFETEVRLVQLVADAVVAAGGAVVRLDPWPDDKSFALTVRHDWDRSIEWRSLWSLLRFYRRHHVRASFGIIVGRTSWSQAWLVRCFGHEINLHTIADSRNALAAEKRNLEKLAGRPVRGFHCHGGSGGCGFLGDRHYEWGEAVGMEYAEMFGRGGRQPCSINRLYDELPGISALVAPGVHASLDIGMKPEQHDCDAIMAGVERVRRYREHMVVMNHPDLHRDELRRLIAGIGSHGVWHATLAEVVDWYRSTRAGARLAGDGASRALEFPVPLPHVCRVSIASGDRVSSVQLPAGTVRHAIDGR